MCISSLFVSVSLLLLLLLHLLFFSAVCNFYASSIFARAVLKRMWKKRTKQSLSLCLMYWLCLWRLSIGKQDLMNLFRSFWCKMVDDYRLLTLLTFTRAVSLGFSVHHHRYHRYNCHPLISVWMMGTSQVLLIFPVQIGFLRKYWTYIEKKKEKKIRKRTSCIMSFQSAGDRCTHIIPRRWKVHIQPKLVELKWTIKIAVKKREKTALKINLTFENVLCIVSIIFITFFVVLHKKSSTIITFFSHRYILLLLFFHRSFKLMEM